MKQDKEITVLPGGPYKVTGGISLKTTSIVINNEDESETWQDGKEYPAKETYTLCRCGQSANKPFCDGTHVKTGFDGTETARRTGYAENATRYTGEAFDLLDDESLCSSMRFCTRALGAWDAVEQSGNKDNRLLAIQECADCAAGRLTLVEKDGTPIEPQLPQEICLVHDTANHTRGPLWVKGGIRLVGADGQPYETRNRLTLCRCGESQNLPFCDASHLKCLHMKGQDE